MYAIVEIAGMQYRVEEGEKVKVNRLQEYSEGDEINIEDVLFASDEENTYVGLPYIEDAKISGEIIGHTKGDKIIVFKKKRRKRYSKKQGHRQKLTEISIESIDLPEGETSSVEEEQEQEESATA